MAFECDLDTIDLVATFGDRHRDAYYINRIYARHLGEAAPPSSAFLTSCQLMHAESTDYFKTARQAYWTKDFVMGLDSPQACTDARFTYYAKGFDLFLIRVRKVTFMLRSDSLHIDLTLERHDQEWRVRATDRSSLSCTFARRLVRGRCSKTLTRRLLSTGTPNRYHEGSLDRERIRVVLTALTDLQNDVDRLLETSPLRRLLRLSLSNAF